MRTGQYYRGQTWDSSRRFKYLDHRLDKGHKTNDRGVDNKIKYIGKHFDKRIDGEVDNESYALVHTSTNGTLTGAHG